MLGEVGPPPQQREPRAYLITYSHAECQQMAFVGRKPAPAELGRTGAPTRDAWGRWGNRQDALSISALYLSIIRVTLGCLVSRVLLSDPVAQYDRYQPNAAELPGRSTNCSRIQKLFCMFL